MLRKEKLFEIKIHGLPKRKRRELETTLRDFAAGLGDSPAASSSQRKKSSRHTNRNRMYSGSGSMSMSKHASSSSGSNMRPVDSAYASMSTGATSSGTPLNRPTIGLRAKSSEQKVESYLRDIPEGLYPRPMALTDREKKKLVVRRLEQIFTGKIAGRHARRIQAHRPQGPSNVTLAPTVPENLSPRRLVTQKTVNLPAEAVREAMIVPHEQSSGEQQGKKSKSQDMGSASNSHADQTESAGNINANGSSGLGTNPSPPMPPPPEQRPTRPKDLDPDRVQIPSENMEYIRHLGLVPPELLSKSVCSMYDVHPDADGWVYLNLLCNMAQLHIMNVTPDFVRTAVADMSAKFQLSPDGRKIRWRGGTEGTRFSSDGSGDNSQRSPETDDTEKSTKDDQRKRQKTGRSTGSGSSGNNASKFGPQVSVSSESFHYKPLFIRQSSSHDQTSLEEDTLSSFGPVEESNGDSRWDQSGSGASNRRKRRYDGAIIYYSGAPFCTDLSGDTGDTSPATYMLSSGQERENSESQFSRPLTLRSSSSSSISHRPLSDNNLDLGTSSKMDIDDSVDVPPVPVMEELHETDSNEDFPWFNSQQFIEVQPLEPCGLGGVLPEDHFMVVVTTKRSKEESDGGIKPSMNRLQSEETTDSIINRLALMSTSSPRPVASLLSPRHCPSNLEIEYVSGRIKRLAPVPLPPPAIFFPPFNPDSWSDSESSSEAEGEVDSSEELMSRQANPHQSDGYPDGVDLTSGDEDGEESDDIEDEWASAPALFWEKRDGVNVDSRQLGEYGGTTSFVEGNMTVDNDDASGGMMARTSASSVATAGGPGSNSDSSGEDDDGSSN